MIQKKSEKANHTSSSYLCINLIDRIGNNNYGFDSNDIDEKQFQLVGCACLLIASQRIEESQPEPKVPVGQMHHDLIQSEEFTEEQISGEQIRIRAILEGQPGFIEKPTAPVYLRVFLTHLGIDEKDKRFDLARYLMDSTLLDTSFWKYKRK